MTTWVPDGDSLALRRSARGITGPMMGDALRDVVDNVRLPEEAIRGARALIAQDRVGAQLSALPGRSWPDTVTIDGQTVRTQQPGASGLLTDTIVDRSRYLTKRKIGDHQWASTMMTQSLGQPRTIATTFTSDVDGEIYALGNVNWRLTNAGQLTSIMVIQTSTGRRISRK